MILELRNMWDVETPLGWGKAFLVEAIDHDYIWTVVLADSGALVSFPQNRIKMARHYTLGINFPDSEMQGVLKK